MINLRNWAIENERGPAGIHGKDWLGSTPCLTLAPLTPTLSSWACGSIDDWIALHNPGAPYQGLGQMLDCADSYQAPADDATLLPVIQEALQGKTGYIHQSL